MRTPRFEQIDAGAGVMAEERRAAPAAVWRRHRVLGSVLLGLALVDLVVATQRHRWILFDPNDYREKVAACASAQHDVVAVGASTVAVGVDPSVLVGLTWHGRPLRRPYNLGLASATASEVWHAVEHGFTSPPRLLIYGVTVSDWNESHQEPNGPRQLMDLGDLASWVRRRPATSEWVARHFVQARIGRLWSLFHYREAIRTWAAVELDHWWPGLLPGAAAAARQRLAFARALERELDGFAVRPGLPGRLDDLEAAGALPAIHPYLEKYRLSPGGHLAYSERLLERSARQGVSVVLLEMPASVHLERMYPQAFAEYRRTLADLARRHGVPLLSASSAALALGDAEFADVIHLNAAGAARFSAWLRTALEKIA
jgi:hypothetical protein